MNPGEMVKFIPVENRHRLFFQFQKELEMFRFLFKTERLYLLMFLPHTLVNLPGSDSHAMNSIVIQNTNKAFQPKVHFTAKHFQRGK